MLIQDSNENHDSERFANRHASTFRTLRLYARTFRRNTSAMFGLAIVVVFLVVAAIGPWSYCRYNKKYNNDGKTKHCGGVTTKRPRVEP